MLAAQQTRPRFDTLPHESEGQTGSRESYIGQWPLQVTRRLHSTPGY